MVPTPAESQASERRATANGQEVLTDRLAGLIAELLTWETRHTGHRPVNPCASALDRLLEDPSG